MDSSLMRFLHADGPAPTCAEPLMLFGRFVGSWRFEGVEHDASTGASSPMHGTWHFGWVLQGRAVQDVLIVPGPGGGQPEEYGSTLRYYDHEADLWRVTWVGPGSNAVTAMTAERLGDEILVAGRNRAGHPLRWVFRDILDDAFRWTNEVCTAGSWVLREELTARRTARW